jgi:hypothetical protein
MDILATGEFQLNSIIFPTDAKNDLKNILLSNRILLPIQFGGVDQPRVDFGRRSSVDFPKDSENDFGMQSILDFPRDSENDFGRQSILDFPKDQEIDFERQPSGIVKIDGGHIAPAKDWYDFYGPGGIITADKRQVDWDHEFIFERVWAEVLSALANQKIKRPRKNLFNFLQLEKIPIQTGQLTVEQVQKLKRYSARNK